jgi:hypothetical protein
MPEADGSIDLRFPLMLEYRTAAGSSVTISVGEKIYFAANQRESAGGHASGVGPLIVRSEGEDT